MEKDLTKTTSDTRRILGLPSRGWITILGLFVVTRLLLSGIGVVSRDLVDEVRDKPYVWVYSEHTWADVWGVWDTGWYLGISKRGYPGTTETKPDILDVGWSANYGFMPLYPGGIALLEQVVGDTYFSALIVSNLAFLAAAALLYLLAESRGGPDLARKTILALFFFPGSFVLSGAFSESLCLALLVGCFLLAERGRWLGVGVAGFFLSLARPIGVFMVIPLGMIWLARYRRWHPSLLFLGLIPLGLLVWFGYCSIHTGDWMVAAHAKAKYWGAGFHNPFTNLWEWLVHERTAFRLNAICGFIFLALMGVLIARRRWVETVTCALLLLVPVGGGQMGQATGVIRFGVLLFPLYLMVGSFLEDRLFGRWILPCLGIIQGFLMVTWANGFHFIV